MAVVPISSTFAYGSGGSCERRMTNSFRNELVLSMPSGPRRLGIPFACHGSEDAHD